MTSTIETNKAVATRFIEGFNTDGWEAVREVVATDFVFHHPDGGTVAAGPEGMVAAWAAFKAAVPDGWHPIPVMIAEGDYLAVLLPTYGHFTGTNYHGIPPTGEWLQYGMVNMVRLQSGKVVEAWFGMDSLAEKQQMGVAPSLPPRQLSDVETANIELFQKTVNTKGVEYDNVTAFDDVVVAMGPPQHAKDAKVRTLEIYRAEDDTLSLVRSHEFTTIPPFAGALSADAELSRAVVTRFFEDVLIGHDLDALARIASPDILIHATALPCEASYYGISGAGTWLLREWEAFPDLTVDDYVAITQGDIVAARWEARGTSKGGFMMLPPSGKEVEFTGVSMYRIEEGKIAEIWETRNTLGLLLQLNPDIGGGHHHH
jgi:predicted ester cyclase